MNFSRSLSLCLMLGGLASSTSAQSPRDPVDYVSPNIGGISHLLSTTQPFVQYPYGMARLAPVTTPGIGDRYLADKIYGFPAGPALLMASTGSVGTRPADYASAFDHDFETATPYYYAADLTSWKVRAELTATPQAAYYRFTFPASQHAHLALSMGAHAEFTVVDSRIVKGSQRVDGPVGNTNEKGFETRQYFFVEFSRPLAGFHTWYQGTLSSEPEEKGDSVGFVSDTSTMAGQTIEVRVGISYISVEQAQRNLQREIPGWDFAAVKFATRAEWNRALSAISITGGTEKQRTIFYTALYRSLGRMTNITEDGRYYSGFDHTVHEAQGHPFYIDDGIWDTYRCMHPLQLLLDPTRQQDMVRSYLRMYEQSGWLPSFPSAAGEQAVMIGHHAAALIADTWAKGYRDFDAELALNALRKTTLQSTMLPWARGPLSSLDRAYFENGFFPALDRGETESVAEVTPERRQAVSVTLENSYDAWCVAQLARALGKDKDAAYFNRLATNYRNLYNPAVGFMAPKRADGAWIDHFDPKLDGGQGGRDYFTEVNTWIYTFNVQHDVAGLVRLMGGRDAFNSRLDQLFTEQYGTSKFAFLGQFPDATGLVGLYAQGNEPSFHIPYLYDFTGQPWKTQFRVRQLMDVWYTDGPLGIPGDDDGGATSSWYVLSALGFYPVCPGSPVYEIGSPLFERAALHMGNGKIFTIEAHHASARNKYIQFARLNGKPLSKAWFPHEAIAQGGTLELEMGETPNLQWGSDPAFAPPSMSDSVRSN
jgi:predicted alpha-1,2-mannosidase